MSATVLDPVPTTSPSSMPARRHHSAPEDQLVLTELDPHLIIDHSWQPTAPPCELITFGDVREMCPKCTTPSRLKLVLRQQNVRAAHLFCPACDSCFDAHYANGACALSI